MLSCQGQTEPRPLDAQPKAASHHHSPHGLYSAPLSEEAPGYAPMRGKRVETVGQTQHRDKN